MNLELAENREELVFEMEHNLNTKPLEIDLLIVKKEKDIRTQNEIRHFFRKYNVLEYKAPGDHLDVDVVIKELEEESHASLRVLTRKPRKKDVSRFLGMFRCLEGKAQREYAESVLEVFTAANKEWVEQWEGEDDMGPALLEIMEPELWEAKERGRKG